MSSANYLRSIVYQFGDPEHNIMLERYSPSPCLADEIPVRMRYASINPSDLITIRGIYHSRISLPFVPGFEGVGAIDGISPQRVLPIGSSGTWQEVKYNKHQMCFPIPDTLSDEQAATSYVNPMTAWLMLTESPSLCCGSKIAINAANSAIGLMLVKMAEKLGFEVTAIVRRAEAVAILEKISNCRILVMENEQDSRCLIALRQSGSIDAFFDCIGGNTALAVAETVRNNGLFISYGLLSGEPIPKAFWLTRPDIQFRYFHLRQWIHQAEPELIGKKLTEVFRLIQEGIADSHITAVFPLTEIKQALYYSQHVKTEGKVLIDLCEISS